MVRKLSAEFFGTFWLVFGGCGSAVLAAAFPELGIGFVGVSLAFGLPIRSGDEQANPVIDDLLTAQVGVFIVALGIMASCNFIRVSGVRRSWLTPASISVRC